MTKISNQPRRKEFQEIFVLKTDSPHRLLMKYYGAFQCVFKKTILFLGVKYELFVNLSRLSNKKDPFRYGNGSIFWRHNQIKRLK